MLEDLERAILSERRSRRLRKRRNRVTRYLGGQGAPVRKAGPLYISARNFSWWIGTLFMAGSLCFAAGTAIAVSAHPAPAGIVFFTGSIFFTSAAYGQLLEVINAGGAPGDPSKVRLIAVERGKVEWQATFVQFAGTLCFNVSTFFAMISALSAEQAKRLVWAPDAFGSIAFLVASWLALKEVRDGWGGRPERGREWRITVLNLVGSIAFGFSAVGAYVMPSTGDLLNTAWSNGGTFIGAVCFFAGAYLLWPEAAEAAADERARQSEKQFA